MNSRTMTWMPLAAIGALVFTALGAQAELLVYEGFSMNDYTDVAAGGTVGVANTMPKKRVDAIGTSSEKWNGMGGSQIMVFGTNYGLGYNTAEGCGQTSIGGSLGLNPQQNNSELRAAYHSLASDVLKGLSGKLYVSMLLNADSAALGKLAQNKPTSSHFGFGICVKPTANSVWTLLATQPSALSFMIWKNSSGAYQLSLFVTDSNKGQSQADICTVTAGMTYLCYAEIDIGAGAGGKEVIKAGAVALDENFNFTYDWTEPLEIDFITNASYPTAMAVAGPYGTNGGRFRADEVRIGTTPADVLPIGDVITVTGFPAECGTPDPGYGAKMDVHPGTTYTFNPPADGEAEGVRWHCTGWEFVTKSGVRTSGTDTAKIAYQESGTLTWLFTRDFKVGFTCSGGDVDTNKLWYAEGADVTVTFTPEGGRAFYKWEGDVAAESAQANPLVFGVDGPKTISGLSGDVREVPSQYATIHAALENIPDGTTVRLAAGTYDLGGLVTLSTPVRIVGAGMGRTVLTNGTKSAVFVLNHAEAEVADLTVSNCTTTAATHQDTMPGNLVSILTGGGTLRNVRFTSCKTTTNYSLGAIGLRAGLIDGCILDRFTGTQQDGGFIHARGGAVVNTLVVFCGGVRNGASLYLPQNSTAVISNCTFYGNTANQNNSNTPGGYWSQAPNARVSNCVFAGNTATSVPPSSWDVKKGEGTAAQFTNTFSNCVFGFAENLVGRGALVYAGDYADPTAMDFRLKRSSPIFGRGYDAGEMDACDLTPSSTSAVIGRDIVVTGAVANATATTAYEWTLSDPAGLAEDVVKTGASVAFTSATPGVRTVTLVAKDGNVQLGTASASVRFGVATNYLAASGVSVPASAAPYDTEATACTDGLQAVYDYAVDGATIVLLPGTHYTSNTVNMTRPVVVTSRDGREATTLMRDPVCTSSGATKTAYYSRAVYMNHAGAVLDGVTLSGYRGTTSPGVTVRIDGAGGTLSRSRLTDCRGNTAYFLGSLSFNGMKASVKGCVIDRIRGDSEGSGGAVYASCGTMESSLVIRNTVGWRDMSGVYFPQNSKAVLRNCTIAKNIADKTNSQGCGVFLMACPSVRLVNCIIAQNSCAYVARGNAWEYVCSNLNTTQIKACFDHCAFGSEATPVGTEGFAFGDDFVDSENDDYHTSLGSSVFEKGVDWPGVGEAVDLDGNPRKSGDAVDAGCYETNAEEDTCEFSLSADGLTVGTELVLTPTVIGNTNGVAFTCTWTITNDDVPDEPATVVVGNPAKVTFLTTGRRTVALRVTRSDESEFASISKPGVLNVAPQEIWIAATGTDVPGSAFPYDEERMAWTNSLEDLLARFAVKGLTVRLAEGTHNLTSRVEIAKGLTLRGAGIDRTFLWRTSDGSYLKLDNAEATVCELTLSGRKVGAPSGGGGAVFIGGSGGQLVGCRVTGFKSSAVYCQAHIACNSTSGLVSRCVIDSNTCDNDCENGTAFQGTAGTVENCLIYGNLERSDNVNRRSKVCYLNGPVTFRSNTVVSNISTSAGAASTAGIYLSDKCGSASIVNCIFADNTVSSKSTADPNWGVATASHANRFDHCAFVSSMDRATAAGTNAQLLRDSSALFRNAARRDYRPRANSALCDSGLYDDWMATATDLAGKPRATGLKKVDIGCYQANHDGLMLLVR